MTCAAAARKRRRARFLTTAPPTFLLTVKPTRIGVAAPGSLGAACRIKPGVTHFRRAAATLRKSARRCSRPTAGPDTVIASSRQALAALGAPVRQHLAATDRL